MNKEISKRAEDGSPIYGDYDKEGPLIKVAFRWAGNFIRVFAYKFGFLLAVESLSKASMACFSWPVLNGLMLYGMTKGGMTVEQWPTSISIIIEAIFVGMWVFKTTTKDLLNKAGDALLEWAKRR